MLIRSGMRQRQLTVPGRPLAAPVLLAGAFLLASPAPAHADLKLCNSTASRIGIAIGYKDRTGWTTEGWWNVASTRSSLASSRWRSR